MSRPQLHGSTSKPPKPIASIIFFLGSQKRSDVLQERTEIKWWGGACAHQWDWLFCFSFLVFEMGSVHSVVQQHHNVWISNYSINFMSLPDSCLIILWQIFMSHGPAGQNSFTSLLVHSINMYGMSNVVLMLWTGLRLQLGTKGRHRCSKGRNLEPMR